MHKNDEQVNPAVLSALLMLASVTKQQQHQQQLNNGNSVTIPRESGKEKSSNCEQLFDRGTGKGQNASISKIKKICSK